MKPATVQYIVNHVFLPPKLPQKDDQDCDNEVALCNLVRKYAQDHQRLLPTERQSRWDPILNMLENFEQSLKSEALNVTEVEQNMEEMQVGGVPFYCLFIGLISLSCISDNRFARPIHSCAKCGRHLSSPRKRYRLRGF